jgi:tRNA1Val (adenine37-N6)-methyltransferase
MANSFFRFKQFTVYQDKCAMKVGTDGVLLGALPDVQGAESLLDIGTGTGLVALMLAQRNPHMHVDAIEIDPDAAQQARQNVAGSPWPHIEVHQVALQQYFPHRQYQIIVSNPPYFVNSLKAPQQARNTARHTDTLSFADLLQGVNRLLLPQGKFWVILPDEAQAEFCRLADHEGLRLVQVIKVHPREDRPAKRVVMCFEKPVVGHAGPFDKLRDRMEGCEVPLDRDRMEGSDAGLRDLSPQILVIEKERHVYTPLFESLTAPYYLDRNG